MKTKLVHVGWAPWCIERKKVFVEEMRAKRRWVASSDYLIAVKLYAEVPRGKK